MPYRVPNGRKRIVWALVGEAIRNVNRTHYDLGDSISEEDLEFKGKSKTDFALDLICECSGYCVPDYIKSGLKWLNDQRVLE